MNHQFVFTNHLKCCEITVKRIFKKERKTRRMWKKPKNIKCKICSNLFQDEFILKSHMRKKHTEPKPLKCNRCYDVFKTQQELEEHLKVHAEDIKCDKCEKVFKDVTSLREHYKDHYKINEEGKVVWECKICSDTFVSWEYRDNHERKHLQSSKVRL